MSRYLFDGLPPKVVTYIKVHLRHIYSTGLFDSQEREDLIQDLVLFYLELVRQRSNMTDSYLFISIKTKAKEIIRTRLQHLQSGFFSNESLNSMTEQGIEIDSGYSLADLEELLTIKGFKRYLSEKEWLFIEYVLDGYTNEEAIAKAMVSKNVLANIKSKLEKKKVKK